MANIISSNNKKINIFYGFLFFSLVFFSCTNQPTNVGTEGIPYDPNKPTILESFKPEIGGLASPVILSGENFGTDISAIKVYFNNKRASIIRSIGNKIYIVTPRQPGDTCTISVVIGKDSITYPHKFIYRTLATVTTIAGRQGSTEYSVNGTMVDAQFTNPTFLCADDQSNFFLINQDNPQAIVLLNEQKGVAQEILNLGTDWMSKMNIPVSAYGGQKIYVPMDYQYGYYVLDRDRQWFPRKYNIKQDPTKEKFVINWKHAFAFNDLDGMVYTRAYDGDMVRFNPDTNIGELIYSVLEWDNYYLSTFDPVNKNILYVVGNTSNCIYTFDVATRKFELFAGAKGQPGYEDGERLNARFNTPGQMVIDADGNIFVCDAGNHCIRKISRQGIVSTFIGIPGKSGYKDGDPETALFNFPTGMAIDNKGTIFIADKGNNVVRKLAIE